MDGWVGGWADGQTDRQIDINEPLINGSLRKGQFKSITSRLAVKSLFNSKFDFESTAPGKTAPTRLEVLKSTQVDLLGSTPRSKSKLGTAPKYLRDHIPSLIFDASLQPLLALCTYNYALLIPEVRTTVTQTRSFATIGPSLWNALPLGPPYGMPFPPLSFQVSSYIPFPPKNLFLLSNSHWECY